MTGGNNPLWQRFHFSGVGANVVAVVDDDQIVIDPGPDQALPPSVCVKGIGSADAGVVNENCLCAAASAYRSVRSPSRGVVVQTVLDGVRGELGGQPLGGKVHPFGGLISGRVAGDKHIDVCLIGTRLCPEMLCLRLRLAQFCGNRVRGRTVQIIVPNLCGPSG